MRRRPKFRPIPARCPACARGTAALNWNLELRPAVPHCTGCGEPLWPIPKPPKKPCMAVGDEADVGAGRFWGGDRDSA